MADRMVTVEEAQAEALRAAAGRGPAGERVSVGLEGAGRARGALGRVLQGRACADAPVPAFRAAVKDGFAVKAGDAGSRRVVGAQRAGAPVEDLRVDSGEAAYITTGAPVPDGADAVVMVEHCSRAEGGPPFGRCDPAPGKGELVHVVGPPCVSGQEIRQVGSDVQEGEVVLEAGQRLGPAEIGLLATVGVQEVSVRRRPLVAVLSTGDEVVDGFSGARPGFGQVRDANRPMLLAAAAEAGAEVLDLGILGDEEGGLEEAIKEAARAGSDVLLTSGGVSMGDKDLLKGTLERLGRIHFGKVLMKPGKPLTFATVPDREGEGSGGTKDGPMLVFGLPGNPVSSAVTFYLVVVPVLRTLLGRPDPGLRRVDAVLDEELRLDPVRPEYHRAVLRWEPAEGPAGGTFRAASTGGQVSSRLLSMRSANALLQLPQRSGSLPRGAVVPALLIADLPGIPGIAEEAAQAAAARKARDKAEDGARKARAALGQEQETRLELEKLLAAARGAAPGTFPAPHELDDLRADAAQVRAEAASATRRAELAEADLSRAREEARDLRGRVAALESRPALPTA